MEELKLVIFQHHRFLLSKLFDILMYTIFLQNCWGGIIVFLKIKK